MSAKSLTERDLLVGALLETLEYFEDRQDADCDQDGFIPNKEMRMASMIRTALAEIGEAV